MLELYKQIRSLQPSTNTNNSIGDKVFAKVERTFWPVGRIFHHILYDMDVFPMSLPNEEKTVVEQDE